MTFTVVTFSVCGKHSDVNVGLATEVNAGLGADSGTLTGVSSGSGSGIGMQRVTGTGVWRGAGTGVRQGVGTGINSRSDRSHSSGIISGMNSMRCPAGDSWTFTGLHPSPKKNPEA